MRSPPKIEAPPGSDPSGAKFSPSTTADHHHETHDQDHLPSSSNSCNSDGSPRPASVGDSGRGIVAASCPRFARLVEHLHALGPRAVGEFLVEVADPEDLFLVLERYARLHPETVRALGCDQFPSPPMILVR